MSDWLSEIGERAERATEGPWRVPVANVFRVVQPIEADPRSRPRVQAHVVADCDPCTNADLQTRNGAADAEFIAHAREDIPALVGRVEELEAALRDLCDAVDDDLHYGTTGTHNAVASEHERATAVLASLPVREETNQ